MNNEERILALLEQMNERLERVEISQATMQTDITEMKTDICETKSDITEMKTNIKNLNQNVAKIENEHGKKIGMLLDAQVTTNHKLDNLQEQTNSIEKKLENSMIIKAVVPK